MGGTARAMWGEPGAAQAELGSRRTMRPLAVLREKPRCVAFWGLRGWSKGAGWNLRVRTKTLRRTDQALLGREKNEGRWHSREVQHFREKHAERERGGFSGSVRKARAAQFPRAAFPESDRRAPCELGCFVADEKSMLLYYSTVLKYIGQREERAATRNACGSPKRRQQSGRASRSGHGITASHRVLRFSVACFGT